MEILAMTADGVLVVLPDTKVKTIIPYGEIGREHPLIKDVVSFQIGYFVALKNTQAANDM